MAIAAVVDLQRTASAEAAPSRRRLRHHGHRRRRRTPTHGEALRPHPVGTDYATMAIAAAVDLQRTAQHWGRTEFTAVS